VEFLADDLPLAVDLHQTGLDEPVDVRIEAAQPGRELRRKHVNGTLGKVHRCAALVGFAVERASVLDVVRYVAMCTPSQKFPLGSFSMVIASSKFGGRARHRSSPSARRENRCVP